MPLVGGTQHKIFRYPTQKTSLLSGVTYHLINLSISPLLANVGHNSTWDNWIYPWVLASTFNIFASCLMLGETLIFTSADLGIFASNIVAIVIKMSDQQFYVLDVCSTFARLLLPEIYSSTTSTFLDTTPSSHLLLRNSYWDDWPRAQNLFESSPYRLVLLMPTLILRWMLHILLDYLLLRTQNFNAYETSTSSGLCKMTHAPASYSPQNPSIITSSTPLVFVCSLIATCLFIWFYTFSNKVN